MADKFIIEGAAFNGNGTSSAEATSNGGVGAWNTITYFEGATPAYGSISPGDVIYIRSKTAAGANITRTMTATTYLGSTLATVDAPVNWILDGGTVWAGVSGQLTYTSANNHTYLRAFNRLEAEVRKAFVMTHTSVSATAGLLLVEDGTEVKHVFFDDAQATVNGSYVSLNTSNGRARIVSCDMRAGTRQAANGCFSGASYGVVTLLDCEIELTSFDPDPVFVPGQYGARLEIFGGRIFGAGATTGASVAQLNSTSAGVFIYGMDIPKAMSAIYNTVGANNTSLFEAIGLDGGAGAVYADYQCGEMDSRSDGYYPTLNALLPTSVGEMWSWRLWPNKTSYRSPFKVPSMKLYTGTAGVKTLTLNFLIADTFTGVTKSNLWLEVVYIDNTTGRPKYFDTRGFAGGNIATSDAPWSATTYGAVNLLKRQIEVTTPTAIKQDTPVFVTLRGYVKAASANDLIFVCPDVVMS